MLVLIVCVLSRSQLFWGLNRGVTSALPLLLWPLASLRLRWLILWVQNGYWSFWIQDLDSLINISVDSELYGAIGVVECCYKASHEGLAESSDRLRFFEVQSRLAQFVFKLDCLAIRRHNVAFAIYLDVHVSHARPEMITVVTLFVKIASTRSLRFLVEDLACDTLYS